MEAIDHKCPACSASLPYNAETGTWKCEYCASEYTMEDLEKYDKADEGYSSKRKMDVDEYSCPNCGAKIITDENTTATFCVYCGSTSIIKNRLTGVLEPDGIIPFKATKEEAIEAFKKCQKGKLFVPKDFNEKENIEKITGVYIPFWLYDCELEGSIEGIGSRSRSWTVGNYRYTKTDRYRVIRGGTANFKKVPVDGSTKFDDDTMDSIEPFIYEELAEFSHAYLSGFLAEKYDVEDGTAYNRAKLRVRNTFVERLKKDTLGYDGIVVQNENIDIDNTKIKYVLLPVWMLNIKYKNKTYLFAMNGQTRKMIGNIPVSISKALLWALGILGGSSIIITIIMYLLGGM